MVTSDAISRYPLPFNKQESERYVTGKASLISTGFLYGLDAQHWLLKKELGDILFASLTLHDSDAVLDSGTGTGCWIIDCHDTFKATVQYYGVDVSSSLFPVVDENITPRLHFSEGDILSPQGKWAEKSYRLVNQRFHIAALTSEDWKTSIGNIYNLLRPGGWVQLFEASHCNSGEATERHWAVLKQIFEERGLLLDLTYNIPTLLEAAGFVGLTTKDYEVSLGKWAGKDGEEARDSCFGVYKGMKHPVVDVTGILSTSEFDLLMDQMGKEWDSIERSKVRYNAFYAQKPESA